MPSRISQLRGDRTKTVRQGTCGNCFGASKYEAETEGHRVGLRESLSRQLVSGLCVNEKEPTLGREEETVFQAKGTAHTKVLR